MMMVMIVMMLVVVIVVVTVMIAMPKKISSPSQVFSGGAKQSKLEVKAETSGHYCNIIYRDNLFTPDWNNNICFSYNVYHFLT